MKKKSFLKKLLDGSKSEEKTQREYVAEQLESRILYSGAPVEGEMPDAAQEAPAVIDEGGQNSFSSIEEFGSGQALQTEEAADELGSVILTSYQNLTPEEIESLTGSAVEELQGASLSNEQLEALDAIEISMVDIEALSLGLNEGYTIELDLNENGAGWFVDEASFPKDSSGGKTQNNTEIITVMMQEMGQVYGLDEIIAAPQAKTYYSSDFEAVVLPLQSDVTPVKKVAAPAPEEVTKDLVTNAVDPVVVSGVEDEANEAELETNASFLSTNIVAAEAVVAESVQPAVQATEEPVAIVSELSATLLGGEDTSEMKVGETLSLTKEQVEALALVAAQRW